MPIMQLKRLLHIGLTSWSEEEEEEEEEEEARDRSTV
jgi:hypothetical protein